MYELFPILAFENLKKKKNLKFQFIFLFEGEILPEKLTLPTKVFFWILCLEFKSPP